MGDSIPPEKPDEQYPLLKVDGGGDISHAAPVHAVVAPGWGMACKKNSKFSRWPEFISAVWMTLILCGISFLIFHVLGMGLNRQQPFIIVKCNNTKPASNVYYHQIIPRGSNVPFILYTEYLATMATKYPLLQFNVIFLLDDVIPDVVRAKKRNPPNIYSWFYNNKLDEMGKDAYNEFKKRYHNVNMSVIPLSKFMAKTPLKYKWRMIPQEYLSFYARVYSVWLYGGIGIDLKTFNNDFHNRLLTDRRIDAILTQHNDGINTAAYTKALNKIDIDESNAIFNIFSYLINHFLNHTRSFFNSTLPVSSVSFGNPSLVRTYRDKREINKPLEIVAPEVKNDPKDVYNVDDDFVVLPTNYTNNMNDSEEIITTTTTSTEKQTSARTSKTNGSNFHELILFYDFTIMTPWRNMAPPLSPFLKNNPSPVSKSVPHLLSIDTDGLFIAASLKFHPFLGRLTSAGCFGIPPKFAIHDSLVTQCSSIFKEDVYCNNIYIL